MTCYTALITPFDTKGELDEEGFRKNLIEQHPVSGLTVLGTTGETPTLSLAEKKRLIQLSRKSAHRLMVGCGANAPSQTLENIKMAADGGADSALIVSPYYNKPTQEGLYRYFKTIASQSPLPLILYNIPGRTCVNLEVETVKKLIDIPTIIGIKEASGDIKQICEIIALKQIRPSFLVYAGDDILTSSVIALGGDGVISVASNLIPQLMQQLVEGKITQQRLLPFFKACAFETNPIPIKAAMTLAGLAAGEPRLPLTPLQPIFLEQLKQIVDVLI